LRLDGALESVVRGPCASEPTVLQTPGGYALTCANVKAGSYLGTHWT
jgi:hypothetical protein